MLAGADKANPMESLQSMLSQIKLGNTLLLLDGTTQASAKFSLKA
ncbi:hypothetical protein [Limnohabitans sp. Rim8]|nr:hypothetical protein [Limnohabitans sp. Rim8]